MEQDPGSLSLDETEQRYYSGLHSLCQTDASSGTLSSPRVAELLQASRLPPEALHQVRIDPFIIGIRIPSHEWTPGNCG
jgi:hypothetical protein